jgi:Spy/CpxP family protein refolding chaperone
MARVLRLMSIVLVVLALVAVSTAAWAQPPRGGPGFGGPFGGGNMSLSMTYGMLLNSPTVQKDLGLLEDQEAKIKEATDKAQTAMRELWSGMRDLSPEERQEKMKEIGKKMQDLAEETKKTVEATLLPKQLERLKGIAIQVAGTMALADKGVQQDLKLSDDQIAKIKSIGEESMKKVRELFEPGADREAMRTKMDELRKDAEKQVMDVLTAEQKDSFEKMKGAKLEIPREELRPRGFGGQRGNRNRDGGGSPPRTTD